MGIVYSKTARRLNLKLAAICVGDMPNRPLVRVDNSSLLCPLLREKWTHHLDPIGSAAQDQLYRTKTPRHQVRVREISNPERQIDALFDEIDVHVGEQNFYRYLGVVLQKGRKVIVQE